MNLKKKGFNYWCYRWNRIFFSKKFINEGSNVLGSGTNEDKLKQLKEEFNIKTEKFALNEHSKIESFVETVLKN